MKNKKVIIWAKGIDDLLNEEGKVAGLTVQMMLWSKTFSEKGWDTFAFSIKSSKVIGNLNFLKYPNAQKLSIFSDIFYSFFFIWKEKADLIIFRGASRNLYFVSLFATLTNTKVVFMGASDVNFIKGKDIISGRFYNTQLYRKGLHRINNIVVQNNAQLKSLNENYRNKALIIPNIWNNFEEDNGGKKLILWVANFRKLKRPEWFINLSKKFPNETFIMAGYPLNKKNYTEVLDKGKEIKNLNILGPVSFKKSQQLFSKAKILICTSEFEGFPNTFLQAWANNIPVISTVNPSELLTKANLGIFVKTENDLCKEVQIMINNSESYLKLQENIKKYFYYNHNPSMNYEKFINYFEL